MTALVDAPSDHPGDDGLAGFRRAAQHAEDLGKVVADVRARVKAPVWLVGTSRSPHGFIEQEAVVAAAIARFIGGAQY